MKKRIAKCILLTMILVFLLGISVTADVDGNGNIIFADPNLKAALLEMFDADLDTNSDGEISENEAANFEIPYASPYYSRLILKDDKSISNIDGIQYFSKIEEIELCIKDISDISPLNSLTQLKVLKISGDVNDEYSTCFDLSQVSSLTSLDGLDISWTRITNFEAVSNFQLLRRLSIFKTDITNINGIENLTQLTEIDANENKSLTDISALSNAVSIESAGLEGNNIKTVPDLSKLVNLHLLALMDNDIRDIRTVGEYAKAYIDRYGGKGPNIRLQENPIYTSETPNAIHLSELDFYGEDARTGNSYDLLWEVWYVEETGIEQETLLIGSYEATVINVQISSTTNFTYNPNETDLNKALIAENIVVTNNGTSPIYVTIKSISVDTDSTWQPTLVEPNKYADWSKIRKTQTLQNVALGVLVEDNTDSILNLIKETETWSTELEAPQKLFVIKPNKNTNIKPVLKAGTAIDAAKELKTNIVWVIGLE